MGTLIVYSEDSAEHRYTICQEDGNDTYFLIVDEELYKEDGRLFEGTFDEVHDKLVDLKKAESLKTF